MTWREFFHLMAASCFGCATLDVLRLLYGGVPSWPSVIFGLMLCVIAAVVSHRYLPQQEKTP